MSCKDCPPAADPGHVPGWLLKTILQAQRLNIQGLWLEGAGADLPDVGSIEQVKVVFRKDQAEIQLKYNDGTPTQILHIRDERPTEEAED